MRRVGAGAVALACALAVAAGSATAGATVATRSRTQIAGPKWDPKLAPIAAEVEAIRGLKFEHAVPVHYLSDAAFKKRLLRDDDPTPGGAQSKGFKRSEARLRALGLLDHDIDLHATARQAVGSGTLAFYDPRDKQVFVKGTDVTAPATRVTLAHELTHALQDQHFNLLKMEVTAAEHDNISVVKGIVEGDATYVQHKFASEMSDAQQQANQTAETSQIAEARALPVPEIIKVDLAAPYALGESLVMTVRTAKGRSGVDALFRTPPESELALVDPSAALERVTPVTVDAPKLRSGETADGHATDLGAFGLFVVLAARLPAADAISVADLWRGDRLVQFARDGRPCVRVDVTGDSMASSTKIRDALGTWSAASGGTGARAAIVATHRAGDIAELTSCAPAGASTPIPENTLIDATRLLSERNALASELASTFGSSARGRCVATKLIGNAAFRNVLEEADGGTITADQARADLGQIIASVRDQILAACG
jgi:hypothetical protein